jgi:hypothetical protein
MQLQLQWQVLIEAIAVGIYTVIIGTLVSFTTKDRYLLFFLTGFLKHALGYFFHIQDYYCQYGVACHRNDNMNDNTNDNTNNNTNDNTNNNNAKVKPISLFVLFLECIGEGLLFILFSFFFQTLPLPFTMFLIGLFMHLFFEIAGLHTLFCKYKCQKNQNQYPMPIKIHNSRYG